MKSAMDVIDTPRVPMPLRQLKDDLRKEYAACIAGVAGRRGLGEVNPSRNAARCR